MGGWIFLATAYNYTICRTIEKLCNLLNSIFQHVMMRNTIYVYEATNGVNKSHKYVIVNYSEIILLVVTYDGRLTHTLYLCA